MELWGQFPNQIRFVIDPKRLFRPTMATNTNTVIDPMDIDPAVIVAEVATDLMVVDNSMFVSDWFLSQCSGIKNFRLASHGFKLFPGAVWLSGLQPTT